MVKKVAALTEFNALKTSGKTMFIDFSATWCPPCKMISPIFHKLATTYGNDNVVFIEVDVDEASEIAQQEEIRAMPTFKVYRKDKKLGELVGASPPQLEALIKNNLPK